ncbi:MAG: hypothetical protein ACKO16_13875 [Gemmataceae bacterium]
MNSDSEGNTKSSAGLVLTFSSAIAKLEKAKTTDKKLKVFIFKDMDRSPDNPWRGKTPRSIKYCE